MILEAQALMEQVTMATHSVVVSEHMGPCCRDLNTSVLTVRTPQAFRFSYPHNQFLSQLLSSIPTIPNPSTL